MVIPTPFTPALKARRHVQHVANVRWDGRATAVWSGPCPWTGSVVTIRLDRTCECALLDLPLLNHLATVVEREVELLHPVLDHTCLLGLLQLRDPAEADG